MKVISIIVTYNALRNNWIYKCLDSLQSSLTPTDIIVIDNNSNDKTCTEIKENYPEVTLIENKENKGFGKANNQGIEFGVKNKFDYFFLLNQDAWIEPETLTKLTAIASKNQDYGIISPMHLTGPGTALDYQFSKYISPHFCENLYSDFVLNQVKDDLYPLKFVNAAAWLLPKKTIEKVGGFSPTFYHYGEDDNYCQRVLYHNLQIGVYPFANIFHDRQDRERNMLSNKKYNWEKNNFIKYSNPFMNYTYENELKYMFKGFIRSIMSLRKQDAIKYYQEIRFIQSNFIAIDKKNKQSKLTVRYNFLDI